MSGIIRLAIFICFSLVIHLLILQIGISRQADLRREQKHGVGYVSRSMQDFVVKPQRSRPIVETRTPQIKEAISALEKSQNAVAPEKAVKSKAVVNLAVPFGSEKIMSIPDPILPVVSGREKPQVKEQSTTEEIEIEQVAEPELAPVLSSQEVDSSSGAPTSVEREELHATSLTEEGGGAKSFQEALPRFDINPIPKYPEIARRRGQEGSVTLEVVVNSAGRVGEIELITSSGFKNLDRAAVKAVSRWQFKPATSLSVPVESRVLVPVDFILNH